MLLDKENDSVKSIKRRRLLPYFREINVIFSSSLEIAQLKLRELLLSRNGEIKLKYALDYEGKRYR